MANPSVEERVNRLVRVRDDMKDLLASEPREWTRRCESVFSEFRVSCVHLRRETEALDSIQEKAVAWRFICKFSKAFPFHHKRCEEVLNILLLSDAWMKEFMADPEVNLDDLPPGIADKFRERLEEVRYDNDPRPGSSCVTFVSRQALTLVVQRCTSATLASQGRSEPELSIGCGLVVAVSFAGHCEEEDARRAARFLLTGKLSGGSGWMPASSSASGSGAKSVLELCNQGEEQGILIYPQISLLADFTSEEAQDLHYDRSREEDSLRTMYQAFVDALQSFGRDLFEAHCFPDIVAGQVGEAQFLQVQSAGPFMHTFSF